jgi:hypothetical protein
VVQKFPPPEKKIARTFVYTSGEVKARRAKPRGSSNELPGRSRGTNITLCQPGRFYTVSGQNHHSRRRAVRQTAENHRCPARSAGRPVPPHPFQRNMAGEVIRLAAMEHPDPAISLRIEVAPDLQQMWWDPIRARQTIVPFVTGVLLSMSGGGEILLAANRQNGHSRIQLRVLGQTLRSSDPAEGRGAYSSTLDAPGGVRILAALRTVLQHGGMITLDQTIRLEKMVSLTLPLYQGQKP